LAYLDLRRNLLANRGNLNKGISTIADQAIVSATSFVTGILVARGCSKDEFGLYVLGLTILVFMMSLQASLITSPYMIRFAKLEKSEGDTLTGSTLIHQIALSLSCASLMMGVSVILARDHSEMIRVLSTVATVIPFVLIKEYIRSVSFARLYTSSVLLSDIVALSIQVTGVLLLGKYRMLSASSALFIVGISCGVAGTTLMVWRRHWFKFDIRQAATHWMRNLGVGRWLLASSFINTISKELYPWMLAAFHGTPATGSFAACLGIVFISNPFVIGLTNLLGPVAIFAYAGEGKHSLFRIVRKSTILVAVVMSIFCLVLIIFGEEILTFIYGSKYEGNGAVVAVLGLSVFAAVLTLPTGLGLYAMERTDLTFKACLCSLAATLFIGIILVNKLGPLGAGLTLLIGNVCESLLKYYMFSRVIALYAAAEERL